MSDFIIATLWVVGGIFWLIPIAKYPEQVKWYQAFMFTVSAVVAVYFVCRGLGID